MGSVARNEDETKRSDLGGDHTSSDVHGLELQSDEETKRGRSATRKRERDGTSVEKRERRDRTSWNSSLAA